MLPQIAAIQMTSGKVVNDNLKTAGILIKNAVTAGANMVVLPEMFSLMGATESKKKEIAEPLGKGEVQDFLANQAAKYGVWIVGGTTPLLHPTEKKISAACLIYNTKGDRVAHYNKLHLFEAQIQGDKLGVYQESKTTEKGDSIVVVDTPLGRIGVAVCYDIRFPELFRILFQQGVEIITIPAAFTAETGKAHWEILLRARAIENFCYVLGACQEGTHPGGRQTFGHSMIIDPWGEKLACLNSGEGFMIAPIDRCKINQIREDMPVLSHQRIDFSTDLPIVVSS